jgi:hypothetical protein
LAWQSPQVRGNAGLLSQQARHKPNKDAFAWFEPVGIAHSCPQNQYETFAPVPASRASNQKFRPLGGCRLILAPLQLRPCVWQVPTIAKSDRRKVGWIELWAEGMHKAFEWNKTADQPINFMVHIKICHTATVKTSRTPRFNASLARALRAGRRIDFAPRLDWLRYFEKSGAFTSGASDFRHKIFIFTSFHKNHFLKRERIPLKPSAFAFQFCPNSERPKQTAPVRGSQAGAATSGWHHAECSAEGLESTQPPDVVPKGKGPSRGAGASREAGHACFWGQPVGSTDVERSRAGTCSNGKRPKLPIASVRASIAPVSGYWLVLTLSGLS